MTEAAYWGWIRSSLRRMSQRWKPIYQCLNEAKSPVTQRDTAKWGSRIHYVYTCSSCRKRFPKKEVEVDHIIPCGSLRSEGDLGPFVSRLLCEVEGLRVMCHECHKAVTDEARGSS
jgi:ribosomal protein L44E